MKRKQMMISFGAYDDDVYEFLQNNKNASALVRMLVRAYMGGGSVSPVAQTATPTKVSETNKADLETVVTTEVEKVVKSEPEVERPMFDYSKCNNGAAMNTNNENRKKIKNLNL